MQNCVLDLHRETHFICVEVIREKLYVIDGEIREMLNHRDINKRWNETVWLLYVGQKGQAVIQAVLLMSIFEWRMSFWML